MRKFLPHIFCLGPLLLLIAAAPVGREAERVLRVIDFEERRLGNPEELPMHWAKIEGAGYPHYVDGFLSKERARSGAYGFKFELNGGSLAYRYDAGRVKVKPRSHYRVETYVRTTSLAHARARLTAYFVDVDGRKIEGTEKHSPLFVTQIGNEGWERLQVELSATKEADSLVMELALLQPAQYRAVMLGEQTLFPQDIRGAAWFDDVAVSQVPKVKMSTGRAGNIFGRGESLDVTVTVNDRSTEDLAAQLVVRDATGREVYQRSGALDMAAAEDLGPGRKRMKMTLPELPAGWYQAALVMSSGGQYVGRYTMDFVLLADEVEHARPDARFGIVATELPFEGWAELPAILPYLGAGRVKLAVWSDRGDVQQADGAGFDKVLARLKEIGVTPTACLLELPPDIAMRTQGSLADLARARAADWEPRLAYLISRHANQLDRWQLGGDGDEQFAQRPEMREVYRIVYEQFARLMQKPDLAMPWPAWHELLPSGELPATVALSVHTSVLPQQIPLYMEDLRAQGGHQGELSLSLHLIDRNKYGREMQIKDLAQRVIYALSADARRIDLPLPFTVRMEDGEGGEAEKQPQEMLMIVRTLMTTLGDATFKGKVPIAEDVEAFLFEKEGKGILALWDRGSSAGVKTLALNLGERPRMVDLWGNTTPLLRTAADRRSQNVRLTVGAMPVFLLDIDGEMAQLRASVAFDRPLIESSFVPHVRKIRFGNPYRQAISGMLKLKGPAGWTINPPVMQFSVNPGETFERDVTVEFPYNSYAGPRTIAAEFDFQTEKANALVVPLTLTLGLSDVGMTSLVLRDGKDILVQQTITNYGDRKIDYTAFVVVPGLARQERLVTNLGPGRSTMKLYRFAAEKIKAGTRVRSGVKELVGTRILNEEVEVR